MIELRVPISPTPAFLNRVVLMAASIRRFHPGTTVAVYVGQAEGMTVEAERRVREAFRGHNIELRAWVNIPVFNAWAGTRSPYLATMNARWHPTNADHVIIADADVIFTGPLDWLLMGPEAVQGVMAHVAPMPDRDWHVLFGAAGLPPPRFSHLLSGGGIMAPIGQTTPWYANSGFIFAPRDLFNRLCPAYHEAITLMRGIARDTYWFDQLAVALAVAKTGVPARALPLAYNFPNQHAFDQARPEELADIRVLHYLRTDTVDRDRDFADLTSMRRLVQRSDLTGSNEVLRRTVAEVMGCLEPPTLVDAGDAPWA